ncbi:glycosyltransferase family 4 protein [Anaeromyxobacter diazotrophicus]|uniref:GDP-mannose-dependent alpha-(1-2)-phosphatidylinositol mannosyltransferase n=1 Tax=Anaeromyxobacter diazotrophicus TaxID=2590199 RepID=A0A7I9VJP4_9BACT|nr:glycosyltransferase family 4 protein [Anaeromyxobacter diazotrophicus]GEJ56419.1 GDP-mannose-dependent alpha-(1-2)-phosphatidylinositol mannosyltransferase [Anaeromyxobacter diazotrophicus]
MRVGIATEYYYPSIGGVQEHVHHFAREARRLGHSVKILTSAMPDLPAPEGEAAGPDVLRLARSRPLFGNGSFGRVSLGPRLARAVRETLARERFDVLHVHCPLTPVLPFVALHYADCPVVGTFHTHFRPGALFALTRRAQQRYLDRLDAAVAVSRACLRAFEGRLRADFRIIPNGVDVERFGRGRPLRRFADGRLNVLWVGRLEPRNGLEGLLAAFAALRAGAEARLLVVGDGPLRPRYEALVPEELREDVVFAGRLVEERPDWYASADVYCAPATIASFGVTLLEAMAAGKPILASDIDGFREVMTHGQEGELLPPGEPEAWARALLRLARDPARGAAYGEHGRRTVQRYAWPRVTSEVLGLYRSIGVAG